MALPIFCILFLAVTFVHSTDEVIKWEEPGATITTTTHTTTSVTKTYATSSSKKTTTQVTDTTATVTTTSEEVLKITSCHGTFITRNIEPNTFLSDIDRSLKTEQVLSVTECAQLCCENKRCCKAVYTKHPHQKQYWCAMYSYKKDSELHIPEGAIVLQEQCCYNGEQVMGEVTLHIDPKNFEDAEAACNAENSTLAMPKTQCAYNILAEVAEAVKPNYSDPIVWIGVTNPSARTYVFSDGDTAEEHGFTLPLAPERFEGESEKYGALWVVGDSWKIADWAGHHQQPFLCQKKQV